MRRVLLAVPLALLATLSSACGGGGGDGDGGFDLRQLHWGIPFVPESVVRTMFVGLRNLDDDGTSVRLQGYMPDGTAYTGPLDVDLDGNDEAHLSVNSALGGDVPAGGWILVSTPSRRVEVFYELRQPGSEEGETARASQLPDLVAPPPMTTAGITVTLRTVLIQISNASTAAKTLAVTPFEEPQSDPDLPPVEHPTFTLTFDPLETKTFDPDGLSGITSFVGSFFFSSAQPFFVAGIEDLALDNQVSVETRFLTISRDYLADVGIRFGVEMTPFGDNVFDFAMTARNDTEEAQTLAVQGIFDQGGTPLIPLPRLVTLDPHESVAIDTTDPFWADVFGDVFLGPPAQVFHMVLNVPGGMDVSFRQFDPVALGFKSTVRAVPIGHVFEVSDVRPDLPGRIELGMVSNPFDVETEVNIDILIPEPSGFDATIFPLTTITVPPLGVFPIVIEGTFLDRDLEPVPFVGARFHSIRSFGLTFYGEERDAVERLVVLSPRVVSNIEDGRH